jgi:hypothetical protein
MNINNLEMLKVYKQPSHNRSKSSIHGSSKTPAAMLNGTIKEERELEDMAATYDKGTPYYMPASNAASELYRQVQE